MEVTGSKYTVLSDSHGVFSKYKAAFLNLFEDATQNNLGKVEYAN